MINKSSQWMYETIYPKLHIHIILRKNKTFTETGHLHAVKQIVTDVMTYQPMKYNILF